MIKKKFGLLVGIAILALTILACGSSTDNVGQATTAPTEAPATQHFHVGDHVRIGKSWNVTVNSIKRSNGQTFITPKAGKTYIVVTLTVNNISEKEQTISSLLNFSLKGADSGKKYEQALAGSDNATLDGKIEAGGKMQGDLTYEVDSTEKAFILAFENEVFSSGQTLWDLKI
jgi:uncharacterized protein (UPF0333 family)